MAKIDTQKIFKNRDIYRHNIPLFARNILKITPDENQEKALVNFQETGRIAVRAGHGVGKTVIFVVLLYHELFCYNNSIVPCTAPTKHQLYDILWTEAARWRAGNAFLEGFFDLTATKIAVRGYENIWYAVAIPSSNISSLAGFHDKHILFLCDEAPGIKDSSWPVIEGALTTVGAKVAMGGNPVRNTGYFADAFGKNAAEWRGSAISCLDSKLVDPEYPKRIARLFGPDSNVYRVRVLGQFPKGESDSVLDVDLIREAMERDSLDVHGDEVVEGGHDVARYGNDRSQMYVRRGMEIVDSLTIVKQDLMEVSGKALSLIRKWAPSAWKVDGTGLGAGVVDRLSELMDQHHLGTKIIGIDNNQRAVNDSEYENAGTEMYWDLRESLKAAKIPDDDELLGELTMRKYKHHRSSGRLMVNSKEDLIQDLRKQGLVARSPDKADALALCFYQAGQSVGGGEVKRFERSCIANRF